MPEGDPAAAEPGKGTDAFRCSHLATIFAAYSPMPQPGAAE